MDDASLAHFKKLLLDIKKKTQLDISGGFKSSLRDSIEELSSYDNHPADIGSETFEMEKNIALEKHQKEQVKKIDDAIKRIDKKTYGICENCGSEIDYKRLNAYPMATLCIKCEDKMDKDYATINDRPAEEDVLIETLKKTPHMGFDASEAWNDVAVYNKTPHINLDWYDNNMQDDQEEPDDDQTSVENITNAEYDNQLPGDKKRTREGKT